MKPLRFSPVQKELRRTIIELSFRNKLPHISSCFGVADLIWAVYQFKKPNGEFILSNGHTAYAWYAVLIKLGLMTFDQAMQLHLHPDRNLDLHIPVSSGSLGHGLPIAIGFALARPQDHIYCMISDGEVAEGSMWESFRFIKKHPLRNLTLLMTANGWGAYDAVDRKTIQKELKIFFPHLIVLNGHSHTQIKNALTKTAKTKHTDFIFAHTEVEQLPFLTGLDAHYKIMTEDEYSQAKAHLQ